MSRRDGLYQWTREVTSAFPQLSKPQATVLAWYSFGAALARSCSLTAVALVLAKEAWQPHWLDLLQQFRGVLPPDYTAVAFTDRGLWAKWLFEAIRAQGWHPMMRVNAGGTFRPQGWYHFRPLKSFAPQLGA